MAGQYGECFCKDLEIDGEFYGPCAVCETATVEQLAQEELVQMMKEQAAPITDIHCACGWHNCPVNAK